MKGCGAVEAVVLAGTLAAALGSVPVGGGAGGAGWLEHAAEMPRRIATTERFLIGELPVWSGAACAYRLVLGAQTPAPEAASDSWCLDGQLRRWGNPINEGRSFLFAVKGCGLQAPIGKERDDQVGVIGRWWVVDHAGPCHLCLLCFRAGTLGPREPRR